MGRMRVRGYLCIPQPRRSCPLIGRSHIAKISGENKHRKTFHDFFERITPTDRLRRIDRGTTSTNRVSNGTGKREHVKRCS